jgi:hypothetical protein
MLAELQDGLLLENVALPQFNQGRLIANALPIKALQATAPGKPVLSVAYERGIGLDYAPAVKRVRRFIAEVAAVGASPVIKGSEYLDPRGWFSVITADAFHQIRQAAGDMLRWRAANSLLYLNCEPYPAVAIPLDTTVRSESWPAGATATLITALALIRAQVPFVFVQAGDPGPQHVPLIQPSNAWQASNRWLDTPALRRLLDPPMRGFSRTYFGNARFRRPV